MIIGEKIKKLRILQNMTQEELAVRSDLTRGFISQIERDLTSPTIENLELVLRALGTDLKEFFSKIDEEEKVVYKIDERIPIYDTPEGVKEELLMTVTEPKKIEPSLIEINPKCSTEAENYHEGFEFGYVIKGRIELSLDSVSHKVTEGESFFYKSNKIHFIKNPSKKDTATVLLIEIY